jgi:hypothetical protein
MSRPPICDPICQKLLLNGDSITALTGVIRKRLGSSDHDELPKDVQDEINAICDYAEGCVKALNGKAHLLSAEDKIGAIADLNHAEDEVLRAHSLFLKAIGYDGAVGKMLS